MGLYYPILMGLSKSMSWEILLAWPVLRCQWYLFLRFSEVLVSMSFFRNYLTGLWLHPTFWSLELLEHRTCGFVCLNIEYPDISLSINLFTV